MKKKTHTHTQRRRKALKTQHC